MTVYPDTFYNSQWFYCKECNWSGDIINIAAKVLKTTEAIAVKHMLLKRVLPKYKNFETALNLYLQRQLKARQIHNEFWENCRRSNLWQSSDPIKICLRNLGITMPSSPSEWLNGMGQLVGFCKKADAENAIRTPRNLDDYEIKTVKGTGLNRTFAGGWKDLLVIPHYDFPGRIREFTFITADDQKIKTTHKHITVRTTQNRFSGMAFMSPIIENKNYKDIIVCDNVISALKLHARNFKNTKKLLPLTAIHDISVLPPFKSLSEFSFVLWNPEVSGDFFERVKSPNVSFFMNEDFDPKKEYVLNRSSPAALMSGFASKKLDCLDLLEKWVPTVTEIEAKVVVGTTPFTADEVEKIREGVYPNIQEAYFEAKKETIKIVNIHGEEFYEDENGWFCKENSVPVSLTKIKITTMVVGGKKPKFFGYLISDGKKIPINDGVGKLATKPWEYIEETLRNSGVIYSGINPKYKKYLKDLAVAFSPPRVITDSEKVGWDKDAMEFKFSKFRVKVNGDVEVFDCVFSPEMPGQSDVLVYEDVTDSDLEKLLVDSENNVSLWPLLSTVVSSILYPAITGEGLRTVFYGNNLGSVKTVLDWMGVPYCRPATFNKNGITWPILLQGHKRKSFVEDFELWLVDSEKPSCLVEASEAEAQVIRLTQKWPMVYLNYQSYIDNQKETVSKIVGVFLSWLLKNHGLSFMRSTDIHFEVLSKIQEWLESKGLNVKIFEKSKKLLVYTGSEEDIKTIECLKKIIKYGLEKDLLSDSNAVVHKNGLTYLSRYKFFSIFRKLNFKAAYGMQFQHVFDKTLEGMDFEKSLSPNYFVVSSSWWQNSFGLMSVPKEEETVYG